MSLYTQYKDDYLRNLFIRYFSVLKSSGAMDVLIPSLPNSVVISEIFPHLGILDILTCCSMSQLWCCSIADIMRDQKTFYILAVVRAKYICSEHWGWTGITGGWPRISRSCSLVNELFWIKICSEIIDLFANSIHVRYHATWPLIPLCSWYSFSWMHVCPFT